jgi:hypothetical protein
MTGNLNLGNDVAYTAAKIVIAGMFFGGLVLGLVVNPWWLLLMPAAIVVLRILGGPL